MLSALFRRDHAQMTAQGVVFTPEDIVRLNALAVKVRLSRDAANTVHLPRIAFLGGLTLREPTIAHDLWIEEASRWIDVTDDRNFLWIHGYALSQKAEKLADAFRPEKLVKTVYRFAAKRLCGFTREQLSAAVEYALFGADWTFGERGPEKDETAQSGEMCQTPPSPTIGLLVNSRALRLPISIEEARKMTASQLEEAITRCLANDEKLDLEKARNAAMSDYVRAREEIRGRSTKTTEAAPSEPTGRT